MSELVWDIKNGEIESVKNEIENKVNNSLLFVVFTFCLYFNRIFNLEGHKCQSRRRWKATHFICS